MDLQNTRLGRPGIELAYFFCSSTSPEQRKNHFDELFKFYYDQFFHELQSLGDTSEPCFTLEELKADYDDCYAFGFIMGCMHSQVTFFNGVNFLSVFFGTILLRVNRGNRGKLKFTYYGKLR